MLLDCYPQTLLPAPWENQSKQSATDLLIPRMNLDFDQECAEDKKPSISWIGNSARAFEVAAWSQTEALPRHSNPI
jgi:hypothetical protein